MAAIETSFRHLTLRRRPNNVFLLTLNRSPENRLNSELCQEIIRALHCIQNEIAHLGPEQPGALVTTSFSEKFFCTGIDLEEPGTNPWAMTDGFYPMLAAFLDFPFPTVACITGHTFGGGGPLALAHDYRVMNEERGFFCMPPIDLGIHFHGIGTLPRLKLRPQVARAMLLEARRWTSKQALEDGIVDVIAPPDKIMGKAMQIAEQWAPKAKMGVYGILRHELYGEAVDRLRSISYVRSREMTEKAKAKI